jgi:hypothetical protein
LQERPPADRDKNRCSGTTQKRRDDATGASHWGEGREVVLRSADDRRMARRARKAENG